MKLSVILPCYNGAETIAVQLEALTNQQWSDDWDVVVVNNGSTDNSMEIVERYRDRLPNLRIVNAYTPPSPRRGVAHSYRVGIRESTGDAFVFCEADDEVAPGWLAAMGEALKEHDFVAGALEYGRLNEPWLVGDSDLIDTQFHNYWVMPDLPYASGCKVGMRRSLYESIGEFDEACKTSWDVDYCWRVQLAGYQLHFVSNAIVHYRLTHNLKDRFRKGRIWAQTGAILLKKYREPKGVLRKLKYFVLAFLDSLLQLLKFPVECYSRKARAEWVWEMGWYIGVWEGALQYLLLNEPLQAQTSSATTVEVGHKTV